MGTLNQEVIVPVADTAAILNGLGGLEGDETLPWIDVLPELKRMNDDTHFALVECQALAVIEQLKTERNGGDPRTTRRKT